MWHLAARWARERDGSADGWATFAGREFAPTWDGFGDNASALEVARQVALIMAGQADMRPLELSGDASRAELLVEGPDPEYLESAGTTVAEIDRMHELVFGAIADRRGMTLDCRRDDASLHLAFARR